MLKVPILLWYKNNLNNLRRNFDSNIVLLAMQIYPTNKLILLIFILNNT